MHILINQSITFICQYAKVTHGELPEKPIKLIHLVSIANFSHKTCTASHKHINHETIIQELLNFSFHIGRFLHTNIHPIQDRIERDRRSVSNAMYLYVLFTVSRLMLYSVLHSMNSTHRACILARVVSLFLWGLFSMQILLNYESMSYLWRLSS